MLLAVLLSVTALGYLLLGSPLLRVDAVDVVGAELLAAEEVRAAAAIPARRPMLLVDTDAVARRVGQLPPVRDVQVERAWPATILIKITERVPLAFISTPAGARLVDSAGMAFATVPVPPPDVPELQAAEGAPTQAAASVLAVLADPSRTALRAEVVAVSADQASDVQLVLRGDRTVRWGNARDSARKADVLVALLSQPGKVYDVASPDLPTIR